MGYSVLNKIDLGRENKVLLKRIEQYEYDKPHKNEKYRESVPVCYWVIFNFSAAKRHWTIQPVRSKKPIYLKNILTSKFKSKIMLLWGRVYALISTENQRLWIHSRLRKIRFDSKRPPEKSDCIRKEINLKELQDI